jgi:hypothetical protein
MIHHRAVNSKGWIRHPLNIYELTKQAESHTKSREKRNQCAGFWFFQNFHTFDLAHFETITITAVLPCQSKANSPKFLLKIFRYWRCWNRPLAVLWCVIIQVMDFYSSQFIFWAFQCPEMQMMAIRVPTITNAMINDLDLHLLEIETNPWICFILHIKAVLILKISNLTSWTGVRLENAARWNLNKIVINHMTSKWSGQIGTNPILRGICVQRTDTTAILSINRSTQGIETDNDKGRTKSEM